MGEPVVWEFVMGFLTSWCCLFLAEGDSDILYENKLQVETSETLQH